MELPSRDCRGLTGVLVSGVVVYGGLFAASKNIVQNKRSEYVVLMYSHHKKLNDERCVSGLFVSR